MTNSGELNKETFFEGIIAEMDCNIELENVSAGGDPEVTFQSLKGDTCSPLLWMPEPGDDTEMSDHTNDEELDDELLEEEELDKLDMDIEVNHESGLWDKANRSQTSGPGAEISIAERGRGTTYKSAEFIDDSE
jgi:hypothetical protein